MPIINEGTFAERGFRIPCSLDGVTVSTSGSWQPAGFQPLTISIEGDFVGEVQLRGSLYPILNTPPPNADGFYPTLLGVAVTGPQIISLPMSLSWWKAIITFAGGPIGQCWAYAFVG